MLHRLRLKKLKSLLKTVSVDGLLIEDPTDLYYLTGLELSAGKLLVFEKHAELIVDGRYFEACQKKSPVPTNLWDPKTFPKKLAIAKKKTSPYLGFDSTKTSYQRFLELQKTLKKTATLVSLESPIQSLRLIKDAEEIKKLRKAGELGAKGFDFVCSRLKEGVTEIALVRELEIFWKKHGGKGVAFDPIIAFGPNTSMPHYHPRNVRLKKGDPVLIDIGVDLDFYQSDMTRVVFFGKPSPRILKIYHIVLEAQERALKLCKPGTLIGKLDEAARNHIKAKKHGKFFPHGLGHGVGLEVHEAPTIKNGPPDAKKPLKPGMVLTVEPGIYLPKIGGIRIEDTVVITKSGHENLTPISKKPLILEPMVEIPARELWLHKNPKAYKSVQRGLDQSEQGKVKKLNRSHTHKTEYRELIASSGTTAQRKTKSRL